MEFGCQIRYTHYMITCKFDTNDKEAYLRHTVVDALVVDGTKILLVKRAAHMSDGGKYAVPGGYMDRDETVQQAVLREVEEETGYAAKIVSLFCIIDNPHRGDDRQNVAFVFIITALKKVRESDHESEEVRWFDLDQLPPKEEMAFDHLDTINLYKEHLKNPQPFFFKSV